MAIQLMSFNIRGARGFRTDGINAWSNRRQLNMATIQQYAPDIIGFQEAQEKNMADYAQQLPGYHSFLGLAASRHSDDEYTPLYWKTERFEAVETGQFYLSPTPEKESLGWESGLVRVAAWLKLREISSNQVFFVLNTHFPHEAEADETRAHCARLIIEKLRIHAADLPSVVMGDFNARPESLAYQHFIAAGLADSYTGTAPVNSFHAFKGDKYPAVGERIDWIMTKGFTSLASAIITDAQAPLFPSDHYPVLAKLAFQDAG